MITQKTIGLFGITANPPHFGHLHAIQESLQVCDEVLISLVYKHPFRKSFVDYEHRLHMLHLLIDGLDRTTIVHFDRDFHFKTNQIPYSYDILKYASDLYSNTSLKLIIGEDNKDPKVWHQFYKHEHIESEFGVIIAKDSGTHSTLIRSLIHERKFNDVEKLCGKDITRYIIEHHLYL